MNDEGLSQVLGLVKELLRIWKGNMKYIFIRQIWKDVI
jgi:hypothetical protein